MRQIRTDLALEKHERVRPDTPGVESRVWQTGGGRVTRIRVKTREAAKAIGKPQGVYYTVETEGFPDAAALSDGRSRTIVRILDRLLPPEGPVLVAGLGNPNITPDALGPLCVGQIFATRHIGRETLRALSLPPLREVSAAAPGVTGQTGVETAEIVDALCRKVRPAAVVAVDALAAGSVKRLSKTVQITDAGIEPGAGVGNARTALNRDTLGVPVIAVGVPTVVDALSLSRDLWRGGEPNEENAALSGMVVAPRDTDTVIRSAARLLALSINLALQKTLTPELILSLM